MISACQEKNLDPVAKHFFLATIFFFLQQELFFLQQDFFSPQEKHFCAKKSVLSVDQEKFS